jgi:hypothetical protein
MGIQYVTVKIDTSGLYQPLSSAVGVVGIAGPAPSAGAGFANPTLFTRPLVGAPTEPYARVVPVLKVSALASTTQTLSVGGNPTGGTFTLSFGGQTSGAIAFNATAAQVQAALQAVSTIGSGGVTCSGGPLPGASVLIVFAGLFAFRTQPLITVGANNLTGGATPAPSVVQTSAGALVGDVQTISVTGVPTAGTFQLAFGGQTSTPVPFNATSAQIQTALAGLSNVGASGVVCSGGALPGTAVTVSFAGPLGIGSQPVISATGSTLVGAGSPTVQLAHTTTGAVHAAVETLSVSGTPTGGGFTLSFGSQSTASIPFNATAAQVQTALTALGSIGASGVVCAGGPLPGTAVTITFAGPLAVGPQPLIGIPNNTLTGGTTPAPSVAMTTPGSATADVQTLSLTGGATAGSFTLTFAGQTTSAIPWNATSAQVQAALSNLLAVGAGNVACSGGPLPGSNVTITFAGQLAPGPQPVITGTATSLIGPNSPAVAVVHTTPGKGVVDSALPVDPDGAVIPNIRWDPAKLSLTDATSGAGLVVDTAAKVLRYTTTGQAFQGASGTASIVLDGFSTQSATDPAPAPQWGIPLDVSGQPVPNLLMRPDTPPANAFLDFGANPLSIDGTLGSSTGGTGKPKATTNGAIYYTVSFDICALAKSINLALENGALQVWGYSLNPAVEPVDPSPAFADFADRQINIVCLSSNSDPDNISALRTHVETSSPNDAGGGGIRPRIGVAMLPMGGISDVNGNLTNKFSDWKTEEEATQNLPSPMNWSSNRMVFVAARSPDDIACAAAGVIAGVDPWVSLILKPVNGIGINGDLSDGAIQTYLAPANSGLTQPHVIPILHPDFLAGSGPVMGEGFTADGTGQRLYIDIVRTIDDIAFRLKAALTSPQVIGTLRINRPGLRVLRTIVRATLKGRVDAGEIDDFAVDIPIQALTEADPSTLTSDQQQQLQQVQNSRQLAFNISVNYSGAIHQLVVTLKFI